MQAAPADSAAGVSCPGTTARGRQPAAVWCVLTPTNERSRAAVRSPNAEALARRLRPRPGGGGGVMGVLEAAAVIAVAGGAGNTFTRAGAEQGGWAPGWV